jgi:hypothetical protein
MSDNRQADERASAGKNRAAQRLFFKGLMEGVLKA